MKTSDFYYNLPEELIAQTPVEPRDQSRLLVFNKETGDLLHKHFYDVFDYLKAGDCLVLNDTRVLPARIFGTRVDTGSIVEFVLLKQKGTNLWECLAGPGKKAKVAPQKAKFMLPDVIKSGARNDTLYRYGCSLQAKGYADDEILNKLEDANTRCDIPLKDEELTTIYNSVLEKEKGTKYIPNTSDMPKEWHPPQIDRDDNGRPYQTINNAREAIEYDQKLYSKIRMILQSQTCQNAQYQADGDLASES